MRHITLLTASFLHMATSAQLTNGCFTIGGPGTDVARAVVQTNDGGYALVGARFLLVATYADGTAQMNAEHPMSGSDPSESAGTDLIQTVDGGYAIVGQISYGVSGVVKLDASGEVQWSKRYDTDGNGEDNLYALAQTPDGGYVLAGSGNVAFTGGSNMLVIKTDAAGEIEWSKAYEMDFSDHVAYDVALALDGGYALCGYRSVAGVYDGFQVLRLDTGGDLLWARGYGPIGQMANTITATPDSGFVVAGRTGTFGFAVLPDGQYDAFVWKLDQSGDVDWARAFGDTLSETFHGVTLTSDGGYAMAGEAEVPGSFLPWSYVAKCDASGSGLWSQKLGADQRGRAWAISECSDGGLAMVGTVLIPGNFQVTFMKMEADGTICPDCIPEPYGSDSAALLSVVNNTYVSYDSVATSTDYNATTLPGGPVSYGCLETSIIKDHGMESRLTLSPNPAQDHCTISLPNAWNVERILVIDARGSTVISHAAQARSVIDLSLGGLAPGLYVMQALGATRTNNARLVITDQ